MNEQDRSQLEILRIEMKGGFELLNQKVDAVVLVQKDHEGRIRSNERWKLSIPISVLLAMATIVGGIIARGN